MTTRPSRPAATVSRARHAVVTRTRAVAAVQRRDQRRARCGPLHAAALRVIGADTGLDVRVPASGPVEGPAARGQALRRSPLTLSQLAGASRTRRAAGAVRIRA